MEDTSSSMRRESVSVWVRDPRVQKEDFLHSYVDYEICVHTNSMCFSKKTSCVRRRYREFGWLRQSLQKSAPLMQLPQLPPRNPFFNVNNAHHVSQRMKGMQFFLEVVLQKPLLLSNSHLHLFLQSQLDVANMEACASGLTSYSVAQAIQRGQRAAKRFPSSEVLPEFRTDGGDSDCESTSSSGLGQSSEMDGPQRTGRWLRKE